MLLGGAALQRCVFILAVNPGLKALLHPSPRSIGEQKANYKMLRAGLANRERRTNNDGLCKIKCGPGQPPGPRCAWTSRAPLTTLVGEVRFRNRILWEYWLLNALSEALPMRHVTRKDCKNWRPGFACEDDRLRRQQCSGQPERASKRFGTSRSVSSWTARPAGSTRNRTAAIKTSHACSAITLRQAIVRGNTKFIFICAETVEDGDYLWKAPEKSGEICRPFP
jgi:hypothetical protein